MKRQNLPRPRFHPAPANPKPRPQGRWRAEGRVVPARHGLLWFREAWWLSKFGLWFWAMLVGGCVNWSLLLLVVPGFGVPGVLLLTVLGAVLFWGFFSGGYAYQTHVYSMGDPAPDESALCSTRLRQCLGPLLLLGLLLFLYGFLALKGMDFVDPFDKTILIFLCPLLICCPLIPLYLYLVMMFAEWYLLKGLVGFSTEAVSNLCLLTLLLCLPMVLVSISAPTLIVVAKFRLWQAIQCSFWGLCRNWRALLLCYLLPGLVFIPFVVEVPLELVLGHLFLFLLPAAFCTPALCYAITRDIFYEEAKPAPATLSPGPVTL